MTMRHGGQVLVDQLKIQGVKRVFCVPGESYLAALDGLYGSGVDCIICRQEGGASIMAEAHGKLTGKPGICFVTRGPGATNGSAGVHIAMQDSSPMIFFVGQVGRSMTDREAFQEIDYRKMFGDVAKWAAQIDDAERIPEYISRAFHEAVSGRPGPVVLALPEDMLSSSVDVEDARPAAAVIARAGQEDGEAVAQALRDAKQPLVIAGGGGWSAEASAKLAEFADKFGLPITTSFRCQDLLHNNSPYYAGDVGIGINPALGKRVREADLLLVLGARLGEMTTGGYSLIDIPNPRQTLVHVYPGAEELGRVYRPDIAVHASVSSLLDRMLEQPAPNDIPWQDWRTGARADYEAWTKPEATPGEVQLAQVVAHLNETLPENAVISNGAGNYTAFVHRYYRYGGFRTELGPTSGSMGYGLPAAIAAKLEHPERTVVNFAGDGCFLMTGQEFATAVQYGAGVITIIANNGMYGTIRMHQERHYPGRVSGTELHNPDFAALAKAYGGHGARVERTGDFPAAFEEAQASGKPSILELKIDPEAITPRATLSAIREAALKSG